jgi:transcriptional regulator with XRE-family HTH domain
VRYSVVLGRVIRQRRELLDITLAVIATRLGYKTVSGWSRVETGETSISVDQLYAVALELRTSPAHLCSLATSLLAELTLLEPPLASASDRSSE